MPFDAWFSRQSEIRRFTLRLGSRVVVGVVAGLAAAAGTLWLDRRSELTLPLPTGNFQLLLGTLVGAVLTIAVFALWMRTVVVGLASAQASPRVLTGYLDDAFQRNLTAWMMASFAYLTAVTAALPSHPEGGEGIPAVSAITSMVLVLTAFSGVLVAIHNATINLSMPQVIRALADRALAVMADQASPDDPPPPTEPGPALTVLQAPEMGWIQAVDHARIMEQLPAGTTLTVDVNVSDFIAEGETMAYADAQLSADARTSILDSFAIVQTRAPEYDLSYAIQQLVAVAEHAMTPSSVDTSTAYEALMHLRAVLHRLLRRGTATGNLRGAEGRWIVAERAWLPADHLDVAFRRLVTGGSQDPTTVEHLRSALIALHRTAGEVEDAASQRVLEQHRKRLEDLADPELAGPDGEQG